MKCRVEYTHEMLPGSISIIGKNNIEDSILRTLLDDFLYNPDQPGLGDRTVKESFHNSSSRDASHWLWA